MFVVKADLSYTLLYSNKAPANCGSGALLLKACSWHKNEYGHCQQTYKF